jgi:hypothetical protein
MARHHPNIGLRTPDGEGKGVKRHVKAIVSKVFPDRYDHDGAEHQHIWIGDVQPLDGGAAVDGDVFVAIRVTDGGVGADIPFEVGAPVEMQGMLIPADEAYPGPDNNRMPVLHFTHRPVGFVTYGGKTYE